jgi:hypothetical protein
MTAIQNGCVVVANATVRGQQKRIGQIRSAVVITNNRVTLAFNIALADKTKQIVELRVENKFTDQPASVRREAGQIFVFAGEQFVVIHHIAVFRFRHPASNHSRLMTTLMNIRNRDGKVVVFNTVRELRLINFKIPSSPWSLLFGIKIASQYIQPLTGATWLSSRVAKRPRSKAWRSHGSDGIE